VIEKVMRVSICAALLLCGCPEKKTPPTPGAGRCEVDLASLALFSGTGTGASAALVESENQLISGGLAQGRVGDVLLQNDRVRVVIQQAVRTMAPSPYGGAIVDADLIRPGQPGRDEFGKLGLIYNFGRTSRVDRVEILSDGSAGGYAVVAATGDDAVIDFFNVNNILGQYLAGAELVIDPNTPLPLTTTTYYVLSPGESRVRIATAFCNSSAKPIVMQVGDLADQGGVSEPFNPAGCNNGFGNKGCLIDPSAWFGFQASGVAYAYRSYAFDDPKKPALNSLLYATGVGAVLAGGEGQAGLISWIDPTATKRPGSFEVRPNEPRLFLRDFFIGEDLADITSSMLKFDVAVTSQVAITVRSAKGNPVASARVAVRTAASQKAVTVAETDANGLATFDLEPGNYLVGSNAFGHELKPFEPLTVSPMKMAALTLQQGPSSAISVSVRDPFSAPLSAKVVVRCKAAVCPQRAADLKAFQDVEVQPSNIQAIAFAGADGKTTIQVPPGQYEVLVTRGMEFSASPDTYPSIGQTVDVRAGDVSVNATLARVIDTTGWISADLHVHAAGSADSAVGNAQRALSFAAEGVDVLVSTDHDFVTDYRPVINDLGLQNQMTSLVGCEVTPFDYGHHNTFPILRTQSPNGGAFDWAGGDGPSLRLGEMYEGLRARDPEVVIQMNHPRGDLGGALTQMKIDTLTSATHADPKTFRQGNAPTATSQDTKLFSENFDALEVMNGTSPSEAVLNDWMTFLSRGIVKVATGVSDTHSVNSVVGGYGRTWLRVRGDSPESFQPAEFSAALRERRAVLSSGPFIQLQATRVNAAGDPLGTLAQVGETISIQPLERLALQVDVQAPEWMQFDSIEIYTHTTGREALNGIGNTSWPEARILQKKTYEPAQLPLEAVPGLNGFAARKIHVRETFYVSPSKDTWFVAMVRGSKATRPLAPLAWQNVTCSNDVCTADDAHGIGLTNPIFVDADGTQRYDAFPLQLGQPLTLATPPETQIIRRVPTAEEFTAFLKRALNEKW
jgi:Carboxypeptidase regulatory-like domain